MKPSLPSVPSLKLFRQSAPSGLWMTIWAYVYLSVVLAGWMVMIWLLTPWTPVVMTSGSMAPAIRAGDVVFLAPSSAEEVAQRTIVSFTDEFGHRVTHRVFTVENGEYTTKGDANASPDTRRLTANDIDGIGRFVIPFIGLPLVWWVTGAYGPFAAWAGSIVLAVVMATKRRNSQPPRVRQRGQRPGSEAARKAVRRVRVLVGFIIGTHFLLDPNPIEVLGVHIAPLLAVILCTLILGASNVVSSWSERPPESNLKTMMPLIELAVDTVFVIALTAITGTSGVGWVLFALPVVEAAVRFGLAGALLHWIGLSAGTIGAQIWMSDQRGNAASTQLEAIKDVVNQLSILLLLALPAAFLAEQLVSDVAIQRIATARARRRGQTLEQVVELGRAMVRLDRSLFDSLAAAGLELGFDRADVVARVNDQSEWQVLAAAFSKPEHYRPFPTPGMAGSGLRPEDLLLSSVVVDRSDEDPDEMAALGASGWNSLVRLSIPGVDGGMVALRVACRTAETIDANRVEALQLLIVQASVGLSNSRLMTELQELNLRVQHDATHDNLTGLPNRAYFVEQLEAATAAIRPGLGVGLLFMDLNGFKPVNDRLGHDAGDELLRLVAARLQSRAGGDVFAARLGGDEFTVVIRGVTDISGAHAVAKRMFSVFDDPFVLGTDQVKISTSIGIAFSDEPIDPNELLRRADTAMYQAKRRGAGTMLRYEPTMDSDERRWTQLLSDLDDAFRSGAFKMHYQPIVDAKATAKVVGVEALIRWTHPDLGAVAPGDVMLLAEKSGRAAELNSWILRHSCADLATLHQVPGCSELFVAVNASPTELALPGIAETIEAARAGAGITPRHVVLEINENLLAQPQPHVADNLDRIVQLGVQLLLDDFGEGQTSFGHMRHLPLAGVKLDRAIVQRAALNRSDRIVMKGIASMAHELGIGIVAEGVETAEEAAAAIHSGVDMMQGYFYLAPCPLEQMAIWLADPQRKMPPPLSPEAASWLAN